LSDLPPGGALGLNYDRPSTIAGLYPFAANSFIVFLTNTN
jgi:hypothetical protein